MSESRQDLVPALRSYVERRSGDPQRRHPRFWPGRAEVVAVPCGFWSAMGFRPNAALRLMDLSLGGAHLVSSTRLEPRSRVDLEIQLVRPALSLRTRAEVLWCRRDTLSLAPRWEAGLAFRALSPADAFELRAIDRYFLG